ncbi:hypothetical protein AMTRI_Chr03g45220 [Amborella trichopoda]
MNSNRQLEIHYINTGFPYTVTESFMDLFEGLAYGQTDFSQESAYWSVHANSIKHGSSGSGSSSYYGHNMAYEASNLAIGMDGDRRGWDHHVSVENEETPSALHMHGVTDTSSMNSFTRPEECNRTHHVASSSQLIWQDNIDPDNMTYEELVELGETVGTHSRGLPQELIASLPVSKYKCCFFSRRKTRDERCVICQMEYKRGDRRMMLPCKHLYHASCVTRWLSINKACPVCYVEVFGEERGDKGMK